MCVPKSVRQAMEHSCFECVHKAHEPGECEQCNCGESELMHTSLGQMARAGLLPGYGRETPMREKYEFDLRHRVAPKKPDY